MPSHRWIPPLLAAALALSPTTPAHAATPSSQPLQTPKTKASQITLITGDRVRVTTTPGRPDQVSFEPTPGSRSDSAVTSYSGGHTYVVPSAASADVLAGRLDRTLFDVTTLIAEQRDDANSKTLPVIIRYSGTAALAKAKQTAIPGATKTRVLTSLGASAAAITRTTDFWRSFTAGSTTRAAAIQRISLDRKVTAQLDQSVPQIGAPAAWQRGLTGKGVKVAVLDTGIDPTHPDVKGRIAAAQNFTPAADAVDHNGHGTHVASITAGNGAASGGKYKGVAPEATLLSGKVLDDDGNGDFSGIIAGIEWAAASGASVINMSLGGGPSDGTDDLSQAVNRISRSTGALFVIAAGNCYSPGPFMVSSPAAADDALAVGNLERDGSLNRSSCRGPRKGDGALKPEISAPGTGIVAARAAGTSRGEPVDDNYTALSGTSMASPHVAGTAALVAQAHPTWKAAQLKARLISTADPQPGSRVDEQGAGRVDADQATDPSVTVDTGELELGVLRWPYPATDLVSRELTYQNPTSTPVTLALAASMDPAEAAPKLSASQLVVPAGGEAKVTVTADRAAAGPGTYSGRITATAAGSDPIVTTIGWYAEAELYDLTINGIEHDGSPANGDVVLSRLDGEPLDLGPFGLPMRDGKVTVRVPPGKYEANTIMFGAPTDTTPQRFDLVTGPETTVAKDTTITLDGRKTVPVTTSVQGRSDLTPRSAGISYLRNGADGMLAGGNALSVSGAPRTLAASPTAKATIGTSEFSTGGRLEVPPYRAQVVGGRAIDALDFVFGPRFTGTKTLQLYDAGAANPGELDGARGKLALIRYSDSDPRFSGQLVKLAEDAGAAAALLYNPDIAGNNGVFSFWAYGEPPEAKIPAVRTSRKDALALIEQLKTGPVSIKLTGVTSTPVVYDYAQPWANHVPAGAHLVLKPSQLARVDEIIGAHTEGTGISESRAATTPMGSNFGTWLPPVLPTPLRRTSYVLANGMRWNSTLVLDNGGLNANTFTPEKTYQAGTRTTERWFAPVENSGLPATPTQFAFVSRDESGFAVILSPFRRGPAEFADPFSGAGEFALSVERDGEEIASATDPGLFVETPAGAAQYRVILDAKREAALWKYSTQVKSVWSFKAGGDVKEVMPLVLADLDVPQADDLNQVQTGKPTVITFGLRHQAGSTSKAKFTSAKLELSYDGTHWSTLPLAKVADGKYRTTVTHPANQAGKAPSLRLTATDQAGGKLEQQVTKAYGLK